VLAEKTFLKVHEAAPKFIEPKVEKIDKNKKINHKLSKVDIALITEGIFEGVLGEKIHDEIEECYKDGLNVTKIIVSAIKNMYKESGQGFIQGIGSYNEVIQEI